MAGDGKKQEKKKPIVIYEPMPAAERERLDARRREHDGVAELPDGFHLVGGGRSGMLYYREGENVLELGWEISGIAAGHQPVPVRARRVGAAGAGPDLGRGPRAAAGRARPVAGAPERTASPSSRPTIWSARGRTSSQRTQWLSWRTFATTASKRSRRSAAPSRRTSPGR